MKRCFIFAAGTYYGLRERPQTGDLVLAADAGYLACRQAGITPDLLLGDFDSMDQPADFDHVRRVPVEKDDTDTMLAVKTALDRGMGTIVFYGCLGGRLDHTYANLQTLTYLARRGGQGWLLGDGTVVTAVENGRLDLPAGLRGAVSVFCPDGQALGVTLRGLHYPLEDYTLTSGFPLGVSNQFTGQAASVSVREGTLLVMWDEAREDVLKRI